MNGEKKSMAFEEGHKRETRKSYQAYIEEITGPKRKDDQNLQTAISTSSDDASEDSNRRRSKRTPVPKRNFKLIDDFQAGKEPPKKRGRKKLVSNDITLNVDATSSQRSLNQEAEAISLQKISVKTEEEIAGASQVATSDFHLSPKKDTPKKRGRKKSSAIDMKTNTEDADTSITPIAKLEPEESTVVEKADTIVELEIPLDSSIDEKQTEEEPEEEVVQRKSGRVRKPKQFKDSVTPSYIKKSVQRSLQTSQEESTTDGPLEAEAAAPAIGSPINQTPKPQHKKRKRGKKDVPQLETPVFETPVQVKTEILTDHSQSEDVEINEPETPRKRKRSSTGGRGKADDVTTSASEQELPQTAKVGRKRSKETVPTDAEEESRGRKVGKKDKKKDKKRNAPPKLVVSFKKKPSERKTSIETAEKETFEIKQEKYTVEEVLVSPSIEPVPLDDNSLIDSQETTTISPQENIADDSNTKSGHKHSKKSKKKKVKTKKKLDSKNQKVIDVQTFPVDDGSIVKVKKKKIYKKRNSTKVLVRIIKNHCNAAGVVVKRETIAVDNVPVDDIPETPTEELLSSPLQGSPFEELSEIGVLDKDEEYFPPEMEKRKRKKSTSNVPPPKVSSKVSSQKQTSKKPVPKLPKKLLSRPANKNVTRGGKVVGKTTKGMKTTGDPATMEEKQKKKACPCCSGRLLKITGPIVSPTRSSEPKNAYNLFCRKYRPIIVENHPKADFSEISRRLASIWNNAPEEDRKEYNDSYNQLSCAFKAKLSKLNRVSPTCWTETEFKYIKKAISQDLHFNVPQYSVTRLQPVDMAAHLQLLGDSLAVIGGALQQQSAMTVHGAMSVLLDSILCALGPLIFLTSQVPEMKAISDEDQAKILDNVAYILPGL